MKDPILWLGIMMIVVGIGLALTTFAFGLRVCT